MKNIFRKYFIGLLFYVGLTIFSLYYLIVCFVIALFVLFTSLFGIFRDKKQVKKEIEYLNNKGQVIVDWYTDKIYIIFKPYLFEFEFFKKICKYYVDKEDEDKDKEDEEE